MVTATRIKCQTQGVRCAIKSDDECNRYGKAISTALLNSLLTTGTATDVGSSSSGCM